MSLSSLKVSLVRFGRSHFSLSTGGCLALARHREPEELERQAVPARLEGEQLLLHEHRLATVGGSLVA